MLRPTPPWRGGLGAGGRSPNQAVHRLFRMTVGGVSVPYLVRYLDDHTQLCPLPVFGEYVALLGRGEATLWRQRELIEGDELRFSLTGSWQNNGTTITRMPV